MISFCISANKEPSQKIIDSIKSLNIEHEIVISQFTGNIGFQKNEMVKRAKFDTLVIMHDYVLFDSDWAKLVLSEERPYDVMMTKFLHQNGNRFLDWAAWDDPQTGEGWWMQTPWCNIWSKGQPCLVPYSYNKTHYMYVSGTYWIAKKEFMLKNPIREDLTWGQSEDVEWSFRARKSWRYIFNPAIAIVGKEKATPLSLREIS